MSKVIVVNEFGGPEVLEVIDRETLEPGPGQVRVRVEATAIHPVDLFVRSGPPAALLGDSQPPYVLGWDLAGVVDAVGDGVTRWSVGQRVVGLVQWFHTLSGTNAEQVVLDAGLLAAAPTSVSAVEAATLPLNAVTAAQALDLAGLEAGQTVAVTGAAGALGGYVVEQAVLRGLRVVAVAGVGDEAWLRGRGVSEFVLRSDDLAAGIRSLVPDGVDGLVNAAVADSVIGAVRDGGALVAVNPGAPEPERGIRVSTVSFVPDAEQLAAAVAAVDRGELTTRVAEVLPFTEAPEAHALQAKGGLRGRVVLTF